MIKINKAIKSVFYAKSDPVETIREHTNQLLIRLEIFKGIYPDILSEEDWEFLRLCVEYHDVGKADPVFQNKILPNIGKEKIKVTSSHEIPHSLLSVMAIPFRELSLSKENERLMAQIVAFHHERDYTLEKEKVAENYKYNILPLKEEIEKQLGLVTDDKVRPSKLNYMEPLNRIQPGDPLFLRYVMLKGLLHRLDHSASAHVAIESASDMDMSKYINEFFKNILKQEKNSLQLFTEVNRDNHLVVVGQTGMGKTEAGLLWLGDSKGFFTLPLRVSINAMYNRITDKNNIGFTRIGNDSEEEATGLLHSTSLDYLYELSGDVEGNDKILEKTHSQSREFANKLIISTIDQILKFPMYYLGFEKEYATIATSKVIIDELQAYNPKIAALLIRAMKMIGDIGGSFMIMTATLPQFYLSALQQELSSSKRPLKYEVFIDDSIKRHNISVVKKSIVSDEIIEQMCNENKKVLVICNTVKRAQGVYRKIADKRDDVKLLHARFTRRDRLQLEDEIMDFAKSAKTGIWVTTQLVEASLDIDFDVLYTEMSTLDSQFQRYGRLNRKGLKPIDKTNIYVLTEGVSGIGSGAGSVYHKDIYIRSLSLLENHKGLLLETEKHEMIKKLYNGKDLEGTSFKEEFDETLEYLKTITPYEFTKKKAQDLLRDIQQVQVIPVDFLADPVFQETIKKWRNAETKTERRKCRLEIESYSINVNIWRAKKVGLTDFDGIRGLYYIHAKYCCNEGLLFDPISLFS